MAQPGVHARSDDSFQLLDCDRGLLWILPGSQGRCARSDRSFALRVARHRLNSRSLSMKRRVLFLTLVFVALCTPAFARQNFIDRFLSKYKPSPSSVPAGPLTQDRLPALIRNGEIPLSVADLINL